MYLCFLDTVVSYGVLIVVFHSFFGEGVCSGVSLGFLFFSFQL